MSNMNSTKRYVKAALLAFSLVVGLPINAAPVQVAPGAPVNYKLFPRLNATNGPGCTAQTVNWTQGATSCSGTTAPTLNQATAVVTSSSGNSGIGNFQCNGDTNSYTFVAGGSSCTLPPPTSCSASTITWTSGGQTCTGAAGTTAVGSSTVVNSTSTNSGNATVQCLPSGNFGSPTSTTCTPPPPANCTSQTVNWTQGTNNCSVASGTRANGSTVTMNSTNGNNGAASVTCNSVSNTYSVAAGATCFPNACTSQNISWSVGGRTCSAPSGSTTHSTSRAVSSTSGNVGSATVTCNAQTNTYSAPTNTSCALPAATACSSQTVSWTQNGNTCSGSTGAVNNNASQSITTNTSGRIGSATVTCSAAGNTYTVSGGTCAPSACTSQTINWSQGGNACSAPSGATNNGVSKSISSTNANTGSVTIACNSTTGAYTQSNATCAAPAPTSCAAGTRSWTVGGVTCSAAVAQTNVNTARTVSSSNGNTGNASFPCTSSGTFGTPTGTSCSAPPPVGCAAANVTWTASGNTCSGSRPAMSSGTSTSVTNTAANRTGSASYSCTNGTVTQGAVSCNARLTTDVRIITDSRSTCAIHNGAAKCWGQNNLGQLGDGTTTNRSSPVQMVGLTSGVTSVFKQTFVSGGCVISNGALWCWPDQNNRPVQMVGFSSGVTHVVGSAAHNCIIHNGAAKCWGRNTNGQLGDGTTTNRSSPVQVAGLTSGVTAIGVSGAHSCAIHNGAAKCWGLNGDGQLGDGTTTQRLTPVQVAGLTSGVTHLKSIFANGSCVIHNGAAKCWGVNAVGQLGDGTTTRRLTPVQVVGLTSGVTSLTSGGGPSPCAIHNGAAKCWGQNNFGQLGDGTTTNRSSPVQVAGLTSGVTLLKIAPASTSVCAIHNGAAKCWGRNTNGQLGDGTTTNRSSPVQVAGLTSGVTDVISSTEFDFFTTSRLYGTSCAIHNGAAKCWGSNEFGQLGDGTTISRLAPVQVQGLTSGVGQ